MYFQARSYINAKQPSDQPVAIGKGPRGHRCSLSYPMHGQAGVVFWIEEIPFELSRIKTHSWWATDEVGKICFAASGAFVSLSVGERLFGE